MPLIACHCCQLDYLFELSSGIGLNKDVCSSLVAPREPEQCCMKPTTECSTCSQEDHNYWRRLLLQNESKLLTSPSTGGRPADTQTAPPESGSSGPRAGAPEGGGGRNPWQLVACDLICGVEGGDFRAKTVQTASDHKRMGSSDDLWHPIPIQVKTVHAYQLVLGLGGEVRRRKERGDEYMAQPSQNLSLFSQSLPCLSIPPMSLIVRREKCFHNIQCVCVAYELVVYQPQ